MTQTRATYACGAFVIAALMATTNAGAQRPVTSTLSRYNVERYFVDSLRTGAQRVISSTGAATRIAVASSFLQGTLLPTRVAGGPVISAAEVGSDIRVILPDRAFTETGEGVGMLLAPVVMIEGGGLRYRDGAFRGAIRVGIEDSLQTSLSVSLPTMIQFFVSGDVDSIRMADVGVDHTNLPFVPIALVEGTHSPTVSVNVRTSLHRNGVDVEVPLLLDELRMDATPRRVQGFGLEEARLVLGPSPEGAGVVVQLSADAGHLADNEVRLSPDGTGTSTLRSYWIGRSTVTARSVPFEDAEIVVDFLFPWIFLVVSLLGGAIGGLAASLQKKDRAARMRRVARATLLGLIASALYAVGVNVAPVSPSVSTGQAVVFGLAALVGYLGTLRVPGHGPV